MFSHDALWYQILQGPIAIIGGMGFGIMWGWLAKYVPEKGDVSTSSCSRRRRCKPRWELRFCEPTFHGLSNAGVSGRTNENFYKEGWKKKRGKLLTPGRRGHRRGVTRSGETCGVSARCRRCVLNVLLKLQPYSRRSQVMSAAARKNVPSRGSGLKFAIYVTQRRIYFLPSQNFSTVRFLK